MSPSAVVNPDTVVVMPGDSVVFCITFRPVRHGATSDTITFFHNGCMQPEQRIVLKGFGIARPAASWTYPTPLVVPTVSHHNLPCGPKQCWPYTFSNPGAMDNVVRLLRGPSPPWSVIPGDSLRVPAGGFASAELCFDPSAGGESSDTIVVATSVRPQFGIVALLARDASMSASLPEGLEVDAAAMAAVRMLGENLRRDTTDGDVLQVYTVENGAPELGIEYTDAGVREVRWPPSAPSGTPAELRPVLEQAIDRAAQLEGSRHVMLFASEVLTGDGFDAAALAAYAGARGVMLHHLLFAPRSSDSLRHYSGTLWSYAEYSNMNTLSAELHAATLSGLAVRYDTTALFARVEVPKLEVQPTQLSFGSVTVGSDRCLPVQLRNTGSAPLRILSILNPADPVPVDIPAEIAPNSQATISLCFNATGFGEATATALIVYDGCPLDTVRIPMTAFGSDSLTVGISGEFVGKPGSIVHIPVQLYAQLPSEYDVRSVEISVQHNKTMLYPLEARNAQEGTIMGAQQIETLSMQPSFGDTTVTTRYRFTRGVPLNNPTPGAVMLRLPYLVLLGDALRTPLRITDIRFNEGLPRAGVAVNGVFRVDSLCFIEQRLLDAAHRGPAKISGVSPNPFNGSTMISIEVVSGCDVHVTLLDIMGRVVAEPVHSRLNEGRYVFTVDAVTWPSGVYLCRMVAGGQVSTVRLILAR